MPSQDIPFSHRLKTKQEFGSKSNVLKTHLSNDASRSSNTKKEIMDRFDTAKASGIYKKNKTFKRRHYKT